MTLVKTLRERLGREPADLAQVAGINLPSYYDLEYRQDELEGGVAVASVAKLAKALSVNPSAFYGGSSTEAISRSDLASRIRRHLARTGEALDIFEDRVGWTVAEPLADPDKFGECIADELRDICNGISINWFDVLDHLEKE